MSPANAKATQQAKPAPPVQTVSWWADPTLTREEWMARAAAHSFSANKKHVIHNDRGILAPD